MIVPKKFEAKGTINFLLRQMSHLPFPENKIVKKYDKLYTK